MRMPLFVKKWLKPPDLVWFVKNFSVVSLRQWNSQASLRFRRMHQLVELYKNLYDESTVRGLLKHLNRRFGDRLSAPIGRSVLIAAVGFCFKDQSVSDEEMKTTENMIQEIDVGQCPNTNRPKLGLKNRDEYEWELMIERQDFMMWRRPLENHPYICEYKCAGTYRDISPASFFVAQMDLEYRKEWDKYVISLDVVDEGRASNSELVRWVTHFPYPMYPREYLYVRRAWVNSDDKVMVLNAKAADHPQYPASKEHVRVDVYSAQMVIRAHTEFNHAGFDYVLTYCDDPKSAFPAPAYKWIVKYGVPGFLDKVYYAAKAIETQDTRGKRIESASYFQQFADINTNNSQPHSLILSY